MRTLKLTIAYDGTPFCGWQVQPNGVSVQQRLQEALASMTGGQTNVIAAGRTDAGVHAFAQAAHFTTDSAIPCEGFVRGLNSILPEQVAVTACEEVRDGFHALRDAAGKIYRYLILASPVRDPMLLQRCWQLPAPLDLKAMREGAKHLVGAHDFESFRAAGCTAPHARRTIQRIEIEENQADALPFEIRTRGRFVSLEFEGDGFVRHMIRNIVGTLVEVGQGRVAPGEVAAIRDARKREQAGRCAPACGLYLVKVLY